MVFKQRKAKSKSYEYLFWFLHTFIFFSTFTDVEFEESLSTSSIFFYFSWIQTMLYNNLIKERLSIYNSDIFVWRAAMKYLQTCAGSGWGKIWKISFKLSSNFYKETFGKHGFWSVLLLEYYYYIVIFIEKRKPARSELNKQNCAKLKMLPPCSSEVL